MPNLERIRERLPKFDGKHHNHAGRHSEQMRKDAKPIELCFPGEIGGHFQIDEIPQDQEIVLFSTSKNL